MKLLKIAAAGALLAIMTGCASVNMAPERQSAAAKEFAYLEDGKAAIYVFRKDSAFGAALKKAIRINGRCVGKSARGVFFYQQVKGGQEYEISTESEFSPNTMTLQVAPGNNYFVEQYMRIGVFSGGANLRLHDEASGMLEVSKLDLARSGNCSN